MAKVAKRMGALPTSSRRSPDSRCPRTATAMAARRPCSVSVPLACRGLAPRGTGPVSVKRADG